MSRTTVDPTLLSDRLPKVSGRPRRNPLPAVEVVRELLELDASTGLLVWKSRPQSWFSHPDAWRLFEAQRVGTVAGTMRGGYRRIEIFGSAINSSWIVWALTHGEWPTHEVDHRSRARDDDRPDQLRVATRSQNQCNVGVRCNNKCGVKGVCWSATKRRWIARLDANGGKAFCKSFLTKDEAAEYVAAHAPIVQGQFAAVESRA